MNQSVTSQEQLIAQIQDLYQAFIQEYIYIVKFETLKKDKNETNTLFKNQGIECKKISFSFNKISRFMFRKMRNF